MTDDGGTTVINTYDINYQEQYDYYKNGASTIRYKHNATSTACICWLRSPTVGNTSNYRVVRANGTPYGGNAHYSYGVVPCFVVA